MLPPLAGFAWLPLVFKTCAQLIQRMGSQFARWPFEQEGRLRFRRHPELHKPSIGSVNLVDPRRMTLHLVCGQYAQDVTLKPSKHHLFGSNSRFILKIPYDLCRKALWEPFRAPFVAFDTPCTASTKARRETPQLFVSPWVELRHGHGTRWQTGSELRD